MSTGPATPNVALFFATLNVRRLYHHSRHSPDVMCVFPTTLTLEGDRVRFWQKLIVVARHVRSTVDLPLLVAGDANVWHPEFSLGRSRPQDAC